MIAATRRRTFKVLVVAAGLGGLVLGTPAPAAAQSAGAQTGWEYAGTGGDPCGFGLPQSGFELPTDEFVLTDSVAGSVMTIEIGPSVAAPQGAAPGDCDDVSDPLVPGDIDITSVSITGPGACSSTNNGTFQRVNSTVTFTFSCGGLSYVVTGNMNICDIPVGPFTTVRSEECAADDDASGHLVTTYVAT